MAADAGNPEAQYALATFYKEGTGVPKDVAQSVRLLQAAALAGNVGPGRIRHRALQWHRHAEERAGRGGAAAQGGPANNPIAQNRLAHVLVPGQGASRDLVEGMKWHLVAKTAGKGDLKLDEVLARCPPTTAPRPRRPPRNGSAANDPR